jgi:hypothetical protein
MLTAYRTVIISIFPFRTHMERLLSVDKHKIAD